MVQGRRGAYPASSVGLGGRGEPGFRDSGAGAGPAAAENKALRATQARLSTERDILRSAAKYFAGETNW